MIYFYTNLQETHPERGECVAVGCSAPSYSRAPILTDGIQVAKRSAMLSFDAASATRGMCDLVVVSAESIEMRGNEIC